MSWEDVPGFVSTQEAYGETTVVVSAASLVEAATYLRDEEHFNMLADVAAADYLGWADRGVSGYMGTPSGRNLNAPMTQGFGVLPAEKPKRFSMSYHLLSVTEEPRRLRLQVWLDDGETVPSVIGVWPTADWHEREAWDLMGIPVDGHPNLTRILLDDDWEVVGDQVGTQ